MIHEYELVEHELADNVTVFCLSKRSSEKDFVDKWMMDAKQQESFDNFTAVITRIVQRGVISMGNSQKLRCVDGKLGLYEIKNYYKAKRVMAVFKEGAVLLFQYEAHKGGSSKNDPKMMKRARKLAEIACALLEEELGENNGNQEREQLQGSPEMGEDRRNESV